MRRTVKRAACAAFFLAMAASAIYLISGIGGTNTESGMKTRQEAAGAVSQGSEEADSRISDMEGSAGPGSGTFDGEGSAGSGSGTSLPANDILQMGSEPEGGGRDSDGADGEKISLFAPGQSAVFPAEVWQAGGPYALWKAEELAAEGSAPSGGTENGYRSPIDFEALQEQNPDVIGWIRIDDTNIDYPILFSGDNDYYLHHDIDGNETTAGSIFLDFESRVDLNSRHNLIYGHRMRNGTMFKDVIKFRDETFFKKHPYYTIYTPEREIRLKVVACFYSANSAELRRTHFRSQAAFDLYVLTGLARCDYSEKVKLPVRSLYTLITCSYEVEDARTMLWAVEVDEDGNQIIADRDYLDGLKRQGNQ